MKKICVVGGSGFIGTQIINQLSSDRITVDVLCRNPHARRSVSVAPGSRLIGVDVYDEQALSGRLQNADAVINLVGILNEKGRDGSGFEKAHVTLLETLVSACKNAGVRRLLQMSALNAGEGTSHYLKTKGVAEEHLTAQTDLDWTIFQPSVVFGTQDSFLNRFHGLLKLAPVMPLACATARMQPVFVGDVARSFVHALRDPATIGKTLELGGPTTYSLAEIVRYVRELAGLKTPIVSLPDWAARLQARVLGLLPGKPFSMDNYQSLQLDSVTSNNALPGLGICPTAMEVVAPTYLGDQQRAGRYSRFRRTAGRN